jgi:hypothetical protein
MIKKILIFAFVLSALIAGCENDDSPVNTNTGNSNHSPNAPNNPNPGDNEINVSPAFVTLSWQCSDPDQGDTLRYDVFYGGNSNTENILASNILITSADLGIVPPQTKIYWKVNAKDNHGGTSYSPIWKFTTGN